MSSNNVRHLVTRTITTLQTLRYTSPHFTALIDTSLPLIYLHHPLYCTTVLLPPGGNPIAVKNIISYYNHTPDFLNNDIISLCFL
jgi:hypothetical protein